jgi:hypothetical protein
MKNKWILIGFIIIGLAVIGLLANFLYFQFWAEEKPSPEPTIAGPITTVNPSFYARFIDVEGKLALSGGVKDEGLETDWVVVVVKVKNITNTQLISLTPGWTLEDQTGETNVVIGNPIYQIGPGETYTFEPRVVVQGKYNWKGAEFFVSDYKFADIISTTSISTPISSPATTPPTPITKVYTVTPENPIAPDEVFVKFIFLIGEENYDEALKLASKEVSMTQLKRDYSLPAEVEGVEITGLADWQGAKEVSGNVFLKNGLESWFKVMLDLEDGVWKVL